MKIENKKIVLETRPCHWCDGTMLVAGKKPCPECSGTGKGKRGKVGGCRKCYGNRTQPDFVNRVPCPVCKDGTVPEKLTDYITKEQFASLEFRVIRTNNVMSWGEQYLAFGSVFNCCDYGRCHKQTDEELIAEVRDHGSTQACSIADDQGNVCDYVAIIVNDQGYLVQPHYDKNRMNEVIQEAK